MPRFISSTPSASAGNRCPPVPPAASRIRGALFIDANVANFRRHCEERSNDAIQRSSHTHTTVILRSRALARRLEGWPRAGLRPSFEARPEEGRALQDDGGVYGNDEERSGVIGGRVGVVGV